MGFGSVVVMCFCVCCALPFVCLFIFDCYVVAFAGCFFVDLGFTCCDLLLCELLTYFGLGVPVAWVVWVVELVFDLLWF